MTQRKHCTSPWASRPLFFLLLVLTPTSVSWSAIIQILHTNDLHAALKTAGEPKPGQPEYGGWAQLKTVLDRYTLEAKTQGIETIRIDAGDFLEGSLYYFTNNGADAMRAYQSLNFDVSTLGNHDWLMGARGLNDLVKTVPYQHALVSANIKVHPRLKALSDQLKPYTIVEKAGVKIGLFGLSTTEAFYKWIPKINSRKRDFRLLGYLDHESQGETIPGLANEITAQLAPQTDAIIAVTHIGFGSDLELVEQSRHLDLVVGGHSHTFLETLNQHPDRDGRDVTVVQSGYNGRNIGRILMEVLPNQPARVLTYELIPVPHDTPLDPQLSQLIEHAELELINLYSPKTLEETIGNAQVRLVPGKSGPTAFSQFAVDALRDSIQAQVAIDVGAFHANTPQAPGIVTRRKLMEMYPRKFEADQNEGLYVYRAQVPGIVLALGLKFSVKYGVFASFSGADYQVEKLSEAELQKEKKKMNPADAALLTSYRAKKITISGKKICLACAYDVAAPESLIRGAYGISPLVRLVIWGGKKTPHTIWDAMENYLRKIKEITPLKTDAHFSPKFYSNSYQKRFGGSIDPDETQALQSPEPEMSSPTPISTSSPTRSLDDVPTEKIVQLFFQELTRAKKMQELGSIGDADELDR